MQTMRISLDFSSLRRVRFYEYALRFLLGGLVTLATGLIAHSFGAAIGGLFLAFPAIFPASCTLVEKHEAEKKKNHGLNGTVRGRKAAALDSFGAVLGKHRAGRLCHRRMAVFSDLPGCPGVVSRHIYLACYFSRGLGDTPGSLISTTASRRAGSP